MHDDLMFQALVLNDAKPVQYVTYKQQPKDTDDYPDDEFREYK